MKLGFSSGTLHDAGFHRLAQETINIFATAGNAIEVFCSPIEEFDKLFELEQELKQFAYLSLHAPTYIRYGKNKETIQTLEFLKKACSVFDVACIVLHPDIVDDWSVFKEYDLPFAIENMDKRKNYGRTVEDMREALEKSGFNMVLDVNHVFTNDPTMQLAKDLKSAFASKIVEIHLSGYSVLHDPLFKTEQKNILDSVPKDILIILESFCKSPEETRKEFEYVKRYFEQ